MESLHDDEAKTTSNEDRRQTDAPDHGGFWGHDASEDQSVLLGSALPDEELQEPEPEPASDDDMDIPPSLRDRFKKKK